jgi:hypothetical protein
LEHQATQSVLRWTNCRREYYSTLGTEGDILVEVVLGGIVKDYLDQVEAGANLAQLFYLALAGALVIPDMCGALESNNGEATGSKYKAWFDTHVAPLHKFGADPILTGENCYRFRCSLLHQGRTQHPHSGYRRMIFVEPGSTGIVMHMNVLNDALNIDVRSFCLEMVGAARAWLGAVQGTEPYDTNFAAFAHRYPAGLAPYIVGIPVIS